MTDIDGLEILSVGKRKIVCLLAGYILFSVWLRGGKTS